MRCVITLFRGGSSKAISDYMYKLIPGISSLGTFSSSFFLLCSSSMFSPQLQSSKIEKPRPIDLQLGSRSIPDGETTIHELTVKKNSASLVITHKWFPVTTAIKA